MYINDNVGGFASLAPKCNIICTLPPLCDGCVLTAFHYYSVNLLFYASLELVHSISPSHVVIKDTTTDSATIQWTVSYTSYSPETYVVKYGTSHDTLIQSRDAITITDMTYSAKLSYLKENSIYYVQVVATNTAQRSSVSSVEQFRTSPLMDMKSGT